MVGLSEPPALAGAAALVVPVTSGVLAAGALGLALPGRMFEVMEPGPNKWMTMPEGGGVGLGCACAKPAGNKAAKAHKNLFFNHSLQISAHPFGFDHHAGPVASRLGGKTRAGLKNRLEQAHEYPRSHARPAGD